MALPAKCNDWSSRLQLCSSSLLGIRPTAARRKHAERAVAAAALASNSMPGVRVGDVLQPVTCQRLGDGVGVCFAEPLGNLVLLVRNALPGELLVARITAVKKGFCEAVKLSTIQAHDHATAPACKHFGTCGGCTLQSLQYPAQLAHKAEAVAQQLMRVGKLPPDLVVAARQEPVPARADEQYGYRNKVQLAFSSRVWIPEENRVLEGAWGLGYYMPGSSSVVLPTTDCLLMSPTMNQLAIAVKNTAQAMGLQPFEPGTGQGCLRYLIIRAASTPAEADAASIAQPAQPPTETVLLPPLLLSDANASGWPAVPSAAPAPGAGSASSASSAVEAACATCGSPSTVAAAAARGGGVLGLGVAAQCLMAVIVTTSSCQSKMLQRVADALMQDCASLGLVSVVHSIEAAAATSAAVAAAAVTATELTGPEHTAISSRLWNDGNLRSGSDVQGDDEAVAGSGLGAMQDQAVQHRQCNGKREQSKGAADRQPKNGNGGSSKVSKRGAQALSVSATTVLAGVSHLQEQLCGLQFSISPHSFFQTNAKQAELLYQQVAAGVQGFYTASSSSSSSSSGDTRDLTANDALTGTVLDLYCGTGTIALTVAGCCRRVIGVDVSASSIADAVDNAQRNGVRNVEFVCGDLAELAHAQNSAAAPGSRGRSSQLSVSPDVIIVDPARAGLSRSVVNYILNSTAKRLMYVSCNAATQARDVQLLCSAWTGANSGMHSHSSTGNRGGQAKHAGKVSPSSVAGSDVAGRDIKGLRPFRLVSWTAVDMFPQTSHVETVVVLDR